jgi:hypothetical protein
MQILQVTGSLIHLQQAMSSICNLSKHHDVVIRSQINVDSYMLPYQNSLRFLNQSNFMWLSTKLTR